MQKVAITGSKGTVGSVLVGNLNPNEYGVTKLDLPEHDVSDIEHLRKVLVGHFAVVHCAWKHLNFRDEGLEADDLMMAYNVYKVSKELGIDRVIMASSNHANQHDNRNAEGKLAVDVPPIPDSPYGAAKVFMEGLGRFYASEGLGVACVRIGNLNADDAPRPLSEEDPQRWLSHRDWTSLVETILAVPEIPSNFVLMNGVSKSPEQAFPYDNPFGWEPIDSSSDN